MILHNHPTPRLCCTLLRFTAADGEARSVMQTSFWQRHFPLITPVHAVGSKKASDGGEVGQPRWLDGFHPGLEGRFATQKGTLGFCSFC